MGATGSRAVPGLALPPGLPSPSAGCGPIAGGVTLPRQPGTPKGVKDDMLDETFIDVIAPLLFKLLLRTESCMQHTTVICADHSCVAYIVHVYF